MQNVIEAFTAQLEKSDVLELLTPNDVLDGIQMYDSTIEIIGYVDGIESPRLVGNKQQYKFFKFFLNNGQGKRVQVIAWNDEIENVEYHIRSNYIIHLDGVQARPPKNPNFNNGNVPYELQIRSNSVVNNLGKYKPTNEIDSKPISTTISDALNFSERILLEGFVKTNFAAIYNNSLNKIIGCGSITDGFYKIEVHILNFFEDDYLNLDINKGDKII